jgi:hypothetical protein
MDVKNVLAVSVLQNRTKASINLPDPSIHFTKSGPRTFLSAATFERPNGFTVLGVSEQPVVAADKVQRAESPKENSPGQSESASDALGQPSTEFPSPERAAEVVGSISA